MKFDNLKAVVFQDGIESIAACDAVQDAIYRSMEKMIRVAHNPTESNQAWMADQIIGELYSAIDAHCESRCAEIEDLEVDDRHEIDAKGRAHEMAMEAAEYRRDRNG